jgi:hypothetical protein
MNPFLFLYPTIGLFQAFYEPFRVDTQIVFDEEEKPVCISSRSDLFWKNLDPINEEIKKDSSLQEAFKKIGIRSDLFFKQKPNINIAQAFGTNGFLKGSSFVELCPSLYEKHPDVCRFIIKHEIAHIKNYDLFWIKAVSAIIGIAAAIFSSLSLGFLAGFITVYVVQLIAVIGCVYISEIIADRIAASLCTDDEKKAAILFFKAMQQMNVDIIKQNPSRLLDIQFTKDGDYRFDVSHPRLSSRIAFFASKLTANETSEKSHDKLFLQKTIFENILKHYISSFQETWLGIISSFTATHVEKTVENYLDRTARLSKSIEENESLSKDHPDNQQYKENISCYKNILIECKKSLCSILKLEMHPLYFLKPRKSLRQMQVKNGCYRYIDCFNRARLHFS